MCCCMRKAMREQTCNRRAGRAVHEQAALTVCKSYEFVQQVCSMRNMIAVVARVKRAPASQHNVLLVSRLLY